MARTLFFANLARRSAIEHARVLYGFQFPKAAIKVFMRTNKQIIATDSDSDFII